MTNEKLVSPVSGARGAVMVCPMPADQGEGGDRGSPVRRVVGRQGRSAFVEVLGAGARAAIAAPDDEKKRKPKPEVPVNHPFSARRDGEPTRDVANRAEVYARRVSLK